MPRKVQKVVDFQSHCPIFRVGTRIPSIYCVLWSKRDLGCLGPFLFFSRERERDVPCYTASHHASHIVDLFFWGFFPPENGQWFSQRRRKSSVPPSPGSFFLCFELFSCLYRHSPCLTGPFLSCPLHMRWCVIVHLLCHAKELLSPSLSFKSERPSLQWKNEPRTRHLRRSLETLDSRSLVTPRRDVST